MHIRLLALASVAAVSAVVAPSFASASTTPSATVRVTVRPVTSTGHPAPGFTLQSEPTGSVDCTAKLPSPGAVDANIDFCSPSAEYAIACWKSAVRQRVLCFRDPQSKKVYRIPRTGVFAPTAAPPVADRAPLLMVLMDGDRCSIRDGGAGGSLTNHPNLYQTYYCINDGQVWASATSHHFGVNEANASWTVKTAPAGNHPLTTRHVKKAYFVGTKH